MIAVDYVDLDAWTCLKTARIQGIAHHADAAAAPAHAASTHA